MWICKLAIFIAIWGFVLTRWTILDQNDIACAELDENAAASFMDSGMVTEQPFSNIGMLSLWVSCALSLWGERPAHGFATK